MADHHAARPPPDARRSGHASQLWSAPPAVNRMEPTKNVTPSAAAPTSCTYPGNGPTRKHVDPRPKQTAMRRRRVTCRILAHADIEWPPWHMAQLELARDDRGGSGAFACLRGSWRMPLPWSLAGEREGA